MLVITFEKRRVARGSSASVLNEVLASNVIHAVKRSCDQSVRGCSAGLPDCVRGMEEDRQARFPVWLLSRLGLVHVAFDRFDRPSFLVPTEASFASAVLPSCPSLA